MFDTVVGTCEIVEDCVYVLASGFRVEIGCCSRAYRVLSAASPQEAMLGAVEQQSVSLRGLLLSDSQELEEKSRRCRNQCDRTYFCDTEGSAYLKDRMKQIPLQRRRDIS